MVQKGALKDKMDEGIEKMPDEQDSKLCSGRGRKGAEGGNVGDDEEHNCRGEGEKSCLINDQARLTCLACHGRSS